MTELTLTFFVIAFGFVTAAMIAISSSLFFGRVGRMVLSFEGTFSKLLSCLFFSLTGPYLLMSSGYSLWRKGSISKFLTATVVLITIFWSFCLGILIIQGLLTGGILAI